MTTTQTASTVIPSAHVTLPSVLTVTSPLVHSDEKVETMQRFRREPYLMADGEILDIPVYSGNAIRGMLRRACALRVCDTLGVEDRTLPTAGFYLLFCGGYLEGSDHATRIEEAQHLRTVLPPVGLLGASHGPRVLHGLLDVWRGEPVCAELADRHADHPAYQDGPVPSVFDLLCEVAYTRRDDRAADQGEQRSPTQMRYSFEALIPGTRLLHGAVLRTHDPVLTGCLADAIAVCTDWQTLGGRAAIGHGRFTWTWTELVDRWGGEIDAYRQHLTDHAGEIRAILGI
jgi:hypothetical protein